MYMYRFALEKGTAAMKLCFQNSSGEECVIANVASTAEACNKIKEFSYERDYHIPYVRVCKHDDIYVFDIGSHTEQFLLHLND